MRGFACCTTLFVFLAASIASAESHPLLADLMREGAVSEKALRELGADPLVNELSVSDSSRQAAFAGVIRIESDGRALSERLARVDMSRIDGAAQAFGRFRDPPVEADLGALRFPESDIEVLADCEVRSCKFKLSRAEIEYLAGIDWRSPAAAEAFTQRFRAQALGYVKAYRERGDRGLVVYADKPEPLAASAAVGSIVDDLVLLRVHGPGLWAYLRHYPEGRRDSLLDTISWSIADFGYRPTLSIDHQIVERAPESEGVVSLIATKTIYANHYLAGRVQLKAVVDGDVAFGVPGSFILLVDRMTFDDSLGRIKRSLLGRGLAQDVEKRMQILRTLADDREI